ncbi:MRG-domain-containing protein [Mycena leptocephala]|nr:MRG-domain-containing protein [Mycena leptocephala]
MIQLVTLPRSPSVQEILEEFEETAHPQLCEGPIVSGLVAYFDQVLESRLLYHLERPQYGAVRRESKRASQIYGAEHFLRMLGKLKPSQNIFVDCFASHITQTMRKAAAAQNFGDYVNELLCKAMLFHVRG